MELTTSWTTHLPRERPRSRTSRWWMNCRLISVGWRVLTLLSLEAIRPTWSIWATRWTTSKWPKKSSRTLKEWCNQRSSDPVAYLSRFTSTRQLDTSNEFSHVFQTPTTTTSQSKSLTVENRASAIKRLQVRCQTLSCIALTSISWIVATRSRFFQLTSQSSFRCKSPTTTFRLFSSRKRRRNLRPSMLLLWESQLSTPSATHRTPTCLSQLCTSCRSTSSWAVASQIWRTCKNSRTLLQISLTSLVPTSDIRTTPEEDRQCSSSISQVTSKRTKVPQVRCLSSTTQQLSHPIAEDTVAWCLTSNQQELTTLQPQATSTRLLSTSRLSNRTWANTVLTRLVYLLKTTKFRTFIVDFENIKDPKARPQFQKPFSRENKNNRVQMARKPPVLLVKTWDTDKYKSLFYKILNADK